jgi:hypothetical protein
MLGNSSVGDVPSASFNSLRHAWLVLNVPVHWRIVTPVEKTPFACGDAARPLRIVIDDLTAPDRASTRLLRSFAQRSCAEVYGTASDRTRRVVIGVPDEREVIPVEYVLPGGGGRRMAVFASNAWIRHSAQTTAAEFGIPVEEALRSLTLGGCMFAP